MNRQWRRAIRYVLPYWRRLALVVALSLFSTVLSLYIPYLSKDLFDRALLGRDSARLIRIVLLFGGISVVSFALNIASGMRYTRVSAEILFDMRLDLYRHLQRLSPRFYARMPLGEIVSRLNNDIGEVQRIAAETALAWVGNLMFLAGTIAMMAWLDLRLFLLSVVLVPPAVWALRRGRRRLGERVAVMRQASSDIGSFLIETLQGMKLVVLSNAQEREAMRFRNRNTRFIRALMSMQFASYLAGGVPGLMLAAASGAVFLYGGSRVIAGTLTMGTFVAFMAFQMRLLPPIQALMGLYAGLATAGVSLSRVYELLDARPDVQEPVAAIALRECRGHVSFEAVSLSLDRGGRVLDGVLFDVRPGEVLALVGASGSGKSTVGDLLLRLLDPDEGTIRLDRHDLRSLRLADLHRHVVLVDENPFIFHASIAENLRYARPAASDEELVNAARAAGIAPFIEQLPMRYETPVGERGMALSAGERQRLAIARAFLADPAILILDEPTASVDPETERQVVAGYEALMSGRTTIVISHRLQLVAQADRVIVLENARIVEEGAPAELQLRGGAFARLFCVGQAVAASS
jgi:ATP-binding cassette subfamily B protein